MSASCSTCPRRHHPAALNLTKFLVWANALPSRLGQTAVDGMFIYLAETYPVRNRSRANGERDEKAHSGRDIGGAAFGRRADMTPTQQRALSGTAIGAGGGAIIGAIAGNAGLGAGIGAVAGLAGGLIYDNVKQDQAASYSAGYQAGASQQPPSPPR